MNTLAKALIKSSVSTIGYETEFFNLSAETDAKGTYILFELAHKAKNVGTGNFPKTYNLLKKHLPSVLKTECSNDKCLPFNEEVKDTEIGHLFEHILLENLYLLRNKHKSVKNEKAVKSAKSGKNRKNSSKGKNSAKHSKRGKTRKNHFYGVTEWNWKKYSEGTFNIDINANLKDLDILPLALEDSILLTIHILNSAR